MKKLLVLGILLLIIAASARQTSQPRKTNNRVIPATITGSVSALSSDVNELDSTLTLLNAAR